MVMIMNNDIIKSIEPLVNSPTPELNTDNWKEFKLVDLFDIVKGNNVTQSGPEKTYPYISSSSTNNGVSVDPLNVNLTVFWPFTFDSILSLLST